MKKLLTLVFMLAVTMAVSIASVDRTGVIRSGGTILNRMTFTTADSCVTSDTLNITITNIQKYFQHVTATYTLDSLSGDPSIGVTLYGRTTSTGSWTSLGTATWDDVADNPQSISTTTAGNYNWLKLEYIASGTTQESRILTLDVRTANMFDVPTSAGTLTISRAAEGTVTIQTADNNANAAAVYRAGGTGALTLGASTGSTTVTSSGTVAVTVSNVEIGATSANETTPSLKIISDADSDAGGDTDETLTIDLTANATPTSAVWDVTSTQSAGYRFDKSMTIGATAPNETLPSLSINGDADSDAADVTEAFKILLTANATPTSATWGFTSTQSAGYTFDKAISVTGPINQAITGGTVVTSAGLLGGGGTATSATQTLGSAGGKAFSYYLSSTSATASHVLTGYYMNVNYGATGGATAAPSGDVIRGRAYLMGDASGTSALTGGAFSVELEATTASNTGLTAGMRGNIVLPTGVLTNAGTYYGTMAEVFLGGATTDTRAYTTISPLGIVVSGTAATDVAQLSNMVLMDISVPANMVTADATMVVTGATGAVAGGLKIKINGTNYWIMLATADE
jgi:hypothetical protein